MLSKRETLRQALLHAEYAVAELRRVSNLMDNIGGVPQLGMREDIAAAIAVASKSVDALNHATTGGPDYAE